MRIAGAAGHIRNVTFYRRRLPHWQPEGKYLFLTWRLHGSLPPQRLFAPQGADDGRAFVVWDRLLDEARSGPTWLQLPEIAGLVCQAIHNGEKSLNHYLLTAWCVMPNHVHLLVLPQVAPSRLLGSLKGFTAHEANRCLGRTGEPFWQRETFDHWIRDERELARVTEYVEQNPVRAGLAARVEEYPFSSASRLESRLAGTSAHPT